LLHLSYASTLAAINLVMSGKSFLGAGAQLREVTIIFVMPAGWSAWNNSAASRWIILTFDI